VVAHNLLHPDDPWETDLDAVPAAIFTSPGIASVGRTEQSCRDDGLDYAASVRPYSDTAYGWAMEDRTGFCKVLAERGTGRLLGAHLLGPQAATLIQPLVVALSCGIDARTLARRPYWIHPALTEVVENAVLDLGPVNNPCGAAGSNVCSTHDEFADRRPGRPRREGPRRVDHR
jgi:mycothione reductase